MDARYDRCVKTRLGKSSGSWMPHRVVRTLVKEFTQGVGRFSVVFQNDYQAQRWLGVEQAGCVLRD